MNFYRAILLLLLFPFTAYSQHEISGTVYNSENGETLPSATIIIENTLKGTITNSDGQFSISIDELPAAIRISYIGFESKTVQLSEDTSLPLIIELEPSVTELDAIVVTDRDPGLSIMERVIERKKIWRAELQNYQSSAYTRQVLENDTSIVSIVESESMSYWKRDKGHREIQLSVQQTSNISTDQNFAGVSYLPNFYDDNIMIAGYNIVGITHPDALRYYNFKLAETLQMDGIPVYKIEVTPKRQRQPTFTGTAYVLGREYALIEVDLKPNDVVRFPPPVQEFDLAYKQQFNNFDGDFWLPVDMRVEGILRIGMVGLRFPPMRFRQLSRLSDYKVNTTIPDSVFQQDDVLSRAPRVQAPRDTLLTDEVSDTSLASSLKPLENSIPLTEEERAAYASIDSTQTLDEAFRPEGFLARMLDDDDSDQGRGFLGNAGDYLPGGAGLNMRFNRSDGFHLGGSYKRSFDAGLQFELFTGYSFNSEKWDYGLDVNQQLFSDRGRRITLSGGYRVHTNTQFSSHLYPTGLQSFSTFLGGDDYSDYFRNERLHISGQFRNILPRVHLNVIASNEHHRSFDLDSELDYSLFGWHRKQRPNPQIEEGNLRSLSSTLTIGNIQSGPSFGFAGSRNLSISAEWSDPAFGSDFDFLKLSAKLNFSVPTFYQRRLFTNTLDLFFSGGTSFGDLPPQRHGSVDGTLTRFTPFGSLKTRPYLPYRGESYWLATAEHNFRTIPFELLGLDGLVDRGWSIILFGGAGYTSTTNLSPESILASDGVHSEIGVSLNSIFGILRLDFAARLDSPGSFIGVSVPRYF